MVVCCFSGGELLQNRSFLLFVCVVSCVPSLCLAICLLVHMGGCFRLLVWRSKMQTISVLFNWTSWFHLFSDLLRSRHFLSAIDSQTLIFYFGKPYFWARYCVWEWRVPFFVYRQPCLKMRNVGHRLFIFELNNSYFRYYLMYSFSKLTTFNRQNRLSRKQVLRAISKIKM